MKESIKIICKKHPSIEKHIINNVLESDSNFDVNILIDVISTMEKYKSYLKKHGFNILLHFRLEDILDEMAFIITQAKTHTFLKKNISVKHRFLIDAYTYRKIDKCINNKLSLNNLRINVINKISKFKNAKDFNSAIELYITQQSEKSVTSIWNKIKEDDVDLIMMDELSQVLVIKVKSYNAIKNIGSPSWCISTNEYFWDQYKTRKVFEDGVKQYSEATINCLDSLGLVSSYNHTFIIWDLKNKDDNKKMIGMTYSPNLKNNVAAHWRNDEKSNALLSDYITSDTCDLFVKENLPTIPLILEKSKNSMYKKVDIIKVVTELNYNESISLIQDSYWKDDKKVMNYIKNLLKKEIYKNLNKAKFKKFLFYLKDFNDNFKECMEEFKSEIKPLILTKLKIMYLREELNPLQFINGVLEELNLYYGTLYDYSKYNSLICSIAEGYLNYSNVIKIENKGIRDFLDIYFKTNKLNNPENIRPMIVKIIIRSFEYGQEDWINSYLKIGISSKILTKNLIIKYMNNNKKFSLAILSNIKSGGNFEIDINTIISIQQIIDLEDKDIVLSNLANNTVFIDQMTRLGEIKSVTDAIDRSACLFSKPIITQMATKEIKDNLLLAIGDKSHILWSKIELDKEMYSKIILKEYPAIASLVELMFDEKKNITK